MKIEIKSLILLLLIYLSCFVSSHVYAIEFNVTGTLESNMPYYVHSGMSGVFRGHLYTCTGWASGCTQLDSIGQNIGVIANANTVSIPNNHNVTFSVSTDSYMTSGNIYTIAVDVCTSSTISSSSDFHFFSGGLGTGFDEGINQTALDYYALSASAVHIVDRQANNCYRVYGVVSPTYNMGSFKLYIYTKNRSPRSAVLLGYNINYVGPANSLSLSQVQSAVSSSVNSAKNDINSSINSMNKNITNEINEMQSKQDETNSKLDDFANTDLPSDKVTSADDSDFKDYEASESQLTDIVDDMDLSDVKIDLDLNSNKFIWNTMTTIITTHPSVFTMFISILSLGVIKLIFGR